MDVISEFRALLGFFLLVFFVDFLNLFAVQTCYRLLEVCLRRKGRKPFVVITDNPLIIVVIIPPERVDGSADPLRCCGNSPAHTPSGCSSHDQNCCGVFDRDDCLQVFPSFIWTPGCFLMHVTSDT